MAMLHDDLVVRVVRVVRGASCFAKDHAAKREKFREVTRGTPLFAA